MVRNTKIPAVLLASLFAGGPVFAQTSNIPAAPDSTEKRNELPVSLDRIRRELAAQPRSRESRTGLRLDYYVEVYGKAPKLELFTQEINLTTAPVMYGGMTHQEFLSVVTPEEFRAPAADIPGAIAALIKWAAEKKKNSLPKR